MHIPSDAFHLFSMSLTISRIACLIVLQEKEEKLDGDAALNKLFRDIYSDADEDMRRAMQKSFVRYLIPLILYMTNRNFLFHIWGIGLCLPWYVTQGAYYAFLSSYMLHDEVVLLMQVESNGTVLSTNWKDVGSKKVEGSPPDGMEMKKWEY